MSHSLPNPAFNNFTTNDDIATKFEVDLPHCVRNVKEKKVLLFKFRCNIFVGVRIIKEMPGSVASGTPCITNACPVTLYAPCCLLNTSNLITSTKGTSAI